MASKSFGGVVKLTGESEYQKALRGIVDNLKVLGSEMKLVSSQYDKNDNSSQKLKATSEVLNKKIEEQKSKINVLKSALSQAENETGKNSATTKKWQIQLNNAEAELNDMNKELEDQHDNLDKSSDKTLKLGDIIKANLISQGIISGIKAVGSAIGKISSSLINVGKQAVQSYAQYEQLVGGVDTLFKDSSQKVQEYANNAYKTAGMSANEYMETVTSFSASLISSLDGDTEKASKVANRAIIDMSDNANKMGTDMTSIQNAYQGFAKQNYTMLDNLKLGYGGTKGEMERLVQEASEMIEVQNELGISVQAGDLSFANIANAISVVQKNMGIMGTTSLEASDTITGSTGSMQSAWQNLITGIADDNADFEKLVNNLVESIVGKDGEGGFINNMLPRIETALNGVVKMVVSLTDTLLPQMVIIGTDLITNLVTSLSENMPALLESAETILNTLINGVMSVLPSLIPMVLQIIQTLVTTILNNLPTLINMGIQMLLSLIQGIGQMLPTLIPTIINAIVLIVETVLDNIDMIIDTGFLVTTSLAQGLLNALPSLIEKIPVIIDKLVMAITNNLPKMMESGIQCIVHLAVGLIKAIPQLVAKIPQIIISLVNGFANYYSKLGEVGTNLIKGLWNGILDAGAWLRDKISGFFGGVVDSIKDFFGIHSPSTVFKNEIGKNLALGVGEGFSDTMSDVTADMQGAIPTEFDTSINMNASSSPYSFNMNMENIIKAFVKALKDVKVVMNNREMGAFVVETMERVVYN